MNAIPLSETFRTQPALAALCRKLPILVEVRFPGMATSPDWYLCDDESELAAIVDKLGPGTELHLNSVWDLKATIAPAIIRK